MGAHDLLAGAGIMAGMAGVVIVVLPGLLIIVASVVLWALIEQSAAGWVAMGLAISLGVAITILKYLHPGRKLREIGIPTSRLMIALGVGVVGFFLIPVVGAFLGFAVAVYLLERVRVGPGQARTATKATLWAIALSIGIELGGGFLIAAVWLVAAIWG
jgi:hypothetical protein